MQAIWASVLCLWLLAPARALREFDLRDGRHPDALAASSLGLLRAYTGNGNASEHFRLLELDGDQLLIGAADAVHNVSLDSFQRVALYRWEPGQAEREECRMKQLDQDLCRNFVRVLSRLPQGRLLVCGTNAFAPACRLLSAADQTLLAEFPAVGLAPFDPAQNSSYLLAGGGEVLYSATVADFAGNDALVFRRNVSNSQDRGLRTQRGNALMLDRPQFVGATQTEQYVYFFFHELAAEAAADQQPGSYSRVARVCKSDTGGPRPHYAAEWSSFLKARLNCSVPERNRPFYFDEIIALSNPVDGLVYATFVSEFNFLRHSVICAFRIAQIDELFRRGALLGYDNVQRRWERRERDEQTAALGQCRDNGTARPQRPMGEDEAIAARRFPLLADAVPNAFPGGAVGIHRGADHYNQIAILPRVPHLSGSVDVLYVSTDQGNVLKMANLLTAVPAQNTSSPASRPPDEDPLRPIATFQLSSTPIRRLLLSQHHLVVVTDPAVFRLQLHFCELYTDCAQCVGAKDPHCVWHRQKCRSWPDKGEKNDGSSAENGPVQDVYATQPVEELCRGKEAPIELERPWEGTSPSTAAPNKTKGGEAKRCECRVAKKDGTELLLPHCECGEEHSQRQMPPLEEQRPPLEGGVQPMGDELQALPWWVLLLIGAAFAQTLAFVWLCCKLRSRRRRAGKCSLPGSLTDSCALSSPNPSAGGGLISAYSPASIFAATKTDEHPGSGYWSTLSCTASNRSASVSPKETTAPPIYATRTAAGFVFANPSRRISLGGAPLGDEISVRLDGSAASVVGSGHYTLPLQHPNGHYQQCTMSTFSR